MSYLTIREKVNQMTPEEKRDVTQKFDILKRQYTMKDFQTKINTDIDMIFDKLEMMEKKFENDMKPAIVLMHKLELLCDFIDIKNKI